MRQFELRKGNYVLNHEGKVVKIDSIFIDEQPCGLFPVVKHSGYIHTDVGFLNLSRSMRSGSYASDSRRGRSGRMVADIVWSTVSDIEWKCVTESTFLLLQK